jgi:hypothetical protein
MGHAGARTSISHAVQEGGRVHARAHTHACVCVCVSLLLTSPIPERSVSAPMPTRAHTSRSKGPAAAFPPAPDRPLAALSCGTYTQWWST